MNKKIVLEFMTIFKIFFRHLPKDSDLYYHKDGEIKIAKVSHTEQQLGMKKMFKIFFYNIPSLESNFVF